MPALSIAPQELQALEWMVERGYAVKRSASGDRVIVVPRPGQPSVFRTWEEAARSFGRDELQRIVDKFLPRSPDPVDGMTPVQRRWVDAALELRFTSDQLRDAHPPTTFAELAYVQGEYLAEFFRVADRAMALAVAMVGHSAIVRRANERATVGEVSLSITIPEEPR